MGSSLRLLALMLALSTGLLAAQAQPPAGEAPPVKVRISQIVGPPELAGKLLHRELAASLRRHRVAVAAGKVGPFDFYLRSYVLVSIEQNAVKVSWVVDVADASGQRMIRFSGEERAPGLSPDPDPWAAVTQPVARAFATEVASAFAAWRLDNSK